MSTPDEFDSAEIEVAEVNRIKSKNWMQHACKREGWSKCTFSMKFIGTKRWSS